MTSPLVVIVGPTASGKSALAMLLANKFNGEIICADSRTVYRGMDIGTAKPGRQDQAEVKHHLLDIVEPDQYFTVAEFKRRANLVIKDITSRGKLPIMVGGSGLYIDSVIFDYNFGKPADLELRKKFSGMSIDELQDLCRSKNIELPENYLNKRYLIRAIEVGGLVQHERRLRPNTIVVGISTESATLRQNIEQRVKQMVENGIVNEVRVLGAKYGWESEAMKGNIYRVFRRVVEGEIDLTQGINESIASDLKLVKKQITWFKRNKQIVWGESDELMGVIERFIKSQKL